MLESIKQQVSNNQCSVANSSKCSALLYFYTNNYIVPAIVQQLCDHPIQRTVCLVLNSKLRKMCKERERERADRFPADSIS